MTLAVLSHAPFLINAWHVTGIENLLTEYMKHILVGKSHSNVVIAYSLAAVMCWRVLLFKVFRQVTEWSRCYVYYWRCAAYNFFILNPQCIAFNSFSLCSVLSAPPFWRSSLNFDYSVLYCFILKYTNVKTVQMPISRWMNK